MEKRGKEKESVSSSLKHSEREEGLRDVLRENGISNFTEFQTTKHSSGLQDSMSFCEDSIYVGTVPDSEGDRVKIERVRGNGREIFSVSLCEGNLRAYERGMHKLYQYTSDTLHAIRRSNPKKCLAEKNNNQREKQKKRESRLTSVIHTPRKPLSSLIQHLLINIQHPNSRLPIPPFLPRMVQNPHRNIPRASRDVQTVHTAMRI